MIIVIMCGENDTRTCKTFRPDGCWILAHKFSAWVILLNCIRQVRIDANKTILLNTFQDDTHLPEIPNGYPTLSHICLLDFLNKCRSTFIYVSHASSPTIRQCCHRYYAIRGFSSDVPFAH